MKNEGNNLPMNVYSKDIKEDEKNQSLSDLIVNASLISNESDDVETKMRRLIAQRRNKGGVHQEETQKKLQDNQRDFSKEKEKIKKGLESLVSFFVNTYKIKLLSRIKRIYSKKKKNMKVTKYLCNLLSLTMNKYKTRNFNTLIDYMRRVKYQKESEEKVKAEREQFKKEQEEKKKKEEEEKQMKVKEVTEEEKIYIPTEEQKEEEKGNLHIDNYVNNIEKKPHSRTKNISKIEKKRKILEEKKRQKDNFRKILERQRLQNEKDIAELEKEIEQQKLKEGKVEEGLSVSMTESLSMSFDSSKRIQNGLELLNFIINSNARMTKIKIFNTLLSKYHEEQQDQFVQKKKQIHTVARQYGFKKKPSNYLDHLLDNKMQQKRNELFQYDDLIEDEKETDKLVTHKRKMHKENSTRDNYNIAPLKDFALEDSLELITPKARVLRQMKKNPTQRDEEKPLIEEDNKEGDKIDFESFDDEDMYSDEEEQGYSPTQLLEYDKFYKEQFFKNEIFKFDPKMKDKEEDEIKQEIERMELKRAIKDKQKIRDVNANKGLDTSKLDKEIQAMKAHYEKKKKKVVQQTELQMNNTDTLLYKGRLLYNYFNEKETQGIPRFSIESERNMKGKEIIDFKPLHKEEEVRRFYDKCCCMKARKAIFKWLTYAKYYCNILVDNFIFENLSLLVIILNTVFILISDPRDTNSIANTSDSIFLYFYTVEAGLKILGFGFIFTEKAYLKDYWNILDFFVIIMGWVSFILERAMNGKKISGLAGLRAFRILRPLKTVKSIKGLRRLVVALLASLSKLSDITIVLFSFFLLFAIGGVQMWQGLFLRRCMSLNYGYLRMADDADAMCTFDSDCDKYSEPGNKYICAKGFINPSNGVINFDNTLTGFVTVFVIATLEGWTDIFTFVSRTFKDKFYINPVIVFFYFHVFIFVGGFYLINLFLAVTNSEFTNIEKIRIELTSKKSFFMLIKSKYDLKEKQKQEKKKKEKELKAKSHRKTGESLFELKYKIEEEAFHIRRNVKDIPVNYTTIKDMYILQNNNPEELYKIRKLVKKEEKYLQKDIEKQIENIDNMLNQKKVERKQMLSQLDSQRKSRSSSHSDDPKYKKRKATQIIARPVEKIYQTIVDMAINYTQKYLKEEMVNLQKMTGKKKVETADLLRQKIEKKEMEKFNMNQISILEDLPFEKERKQNEENERRERNRLKKLEKAKEKTEKGPKTNRTSNLVSKRVLKEIYRKKKNNNKIDDELSFMTDLSLSSQGELNLDNTQNSRILNMNNMSSINMNNSSNLIDITDNNISGMNQTNNLHTISNNNVNASQISIGNNQSIIARKNVMINEEDHIETQVDIPKPSILLPEIMKLRGDAIIQAKLEAMRKHFNINDFLQKQANRGVPITSLGRRKSFLNFLQYNQEKENMDELFKGIPTERDIKEGNSTLRLDISLYNNEDNVSINSDDISNKSMLPQDLPQGNDVFDENMNTDDMSKKLQLNKFTSYTRKSFLDRSTKKGTQNLTYTQQKNFYEKVNQNMNQNIIIDSKPPKGRDLDSSITSHIFPNKEFDIDEFEEERNLTKSAASNLQGSMAEKNVSNIGRGRKRSRKVEDGDYVDFKSHSIDRCLLKYPMAESNELIVEEQNKKSTETLTPQQELITQNWRSRKYYMNYLYNIQQKEIKVKDNFKIDQWKGEILGKQKPTIKRKKLPESIEAVFVFNDKELNLKKYKYLYNKKFEYLDNECAYLTHNLKNLPINILEIMPVRMRDFGKYAVGKEIDLGALASHSSSRSNSLSTSRLTGTQSTYASSGMNRTKSTLCAGSAFSLGHKIQDDMKYKKGLYEKIYKKIEDFNYRTLSHYFNEEDNLYLKMTDDKHREEKEKEEEEYNRSKESSLEVKTEVRNIRVFDIKTNSARYVQWSGQDVLYKKDFGKDDEISDRYNRMISALEDFGVIIWKRAPGVKQFQKIRFGLYLVSTNQYFDFFIMFLVIANAVIMALDGNMFTPEVYSNISITNYVFNSIFIAEFILKLIGLGPIVYFSDAFTYLDLVIIIFAIVDMASSSDSSADTIGANKNLTSQLSFLRVFRIFRVLRLTKILRKMKSMRLIIVSIKKSLASVTYIILILVMFLLIFQLLGESLLNGNIRYQSFLIAFYTTFQILTTENWNSVFFELYPLSPFTFFYYLVWIFLGNYILFNLFISILLQSFDDSNDNDEDDEDEDEIIEKNFGLPDYLYKLKQIEVEHKNRMKTAKEKARNKSNPSGLGTMSNSNSVSRLSKMSYSNVSGSESSMSSSSQMLSETKDEDEEEEENSKVLTGVDKNIKNWQKINQLFRKNDCENSLYLLSQINFFRIWCMKLATNKKFDAFILVMILLSTARLILDTFIAGYTSVLVFDMCDLFFNFVFLFEMIIKIIALGFIMDEGTYVRDNWNKIDLIIVVVSLIDIQSLVQKYLQNNNNASSSLNFLKVLRLLRTLRPLRFISHNVQLKLIITSLFDSILPICNALFIVIIVFFMFSIVGISLFYNLYHNCYVSGKDTAFKIADTDFSNYLVTFNINNNMPDIEKFCADRYNGIMDTGPKFKFSNIFISLVTSYVLGNMEGWPDIMNDYRVFNDYYGIFFVAYLLVVSYFFLNLFTGIMFKYFNDAWSKEKKVGENDKKAEKYYDFLQQIELADPEYSTYLSPEEGTIKYYLVMVANSKFLDNFIMIIILLNMIVMAINYDATPSGYQSMLDTLNLIFTSIFIAEAVLKIAALGVFGYFYYGWNRFDFFVVIASIADLVIARIDGIDASFLKSFQIIRVLRVLRVTRVLRLVKSLKSLEKLLQTLRWSLNALANVFILMFLIFCIFAILGCYLYDQITYNKYKDDFVYLNNFYNFDNFYQAFLLCFRCATGEDWPSLMMEIAFIDEDVVSQPQAYLYMIFMNFISAVIMLNLFLMVTLQQYDEFTNKSYNPVEMFESFLNDFKSSWNKYSSSKDNGYRIKKILIANFFVEFNWKKLNFPEINRLEHIKKYVSELKLRTDPENYVYFHDVLFKIIVKQMGAKVDRTLPENAIIIKEEKKIAEVIKKKINKYILEHEINKNKLKNPLNTFNPLTSHLYFKISYLYFKTFINYYKENVELNFTDVNTSGSASGSVSKIMEGNQKDESSESSGNGNIKILGIAEAVEKTPRSLESNGNIDVGASKDNSQLL